jgi:hypothetical protein
MFYVACSCNKLNNRLEEVMWAPAVSTTFKDTRGSPRPLPQKQSQIDILIICGP